MKCIIALMLSALAVANEVGLGQMRPRIGIAVFLTMIWGVFKLIRESI